MKIRPVKARPLWQEQVRALGYSVQLLCHPPYWIEAAPEPFAAAFSHAEIELIQTATKELTDLCEKVVAEVCAGPRSQDLLARLSIPLPFHAAVKESWQRGDRSLYGRFDFAYCNGSLKLLELNFDTPTTLYESGLLQRLWLDDLIENGTLAHTAQQCNCLEERLIAAFSRIVRAGETLHLGTFKHAVEELENVKYLKTLAERAGLRAQLIHFDDILSDQGLIFAPDREQISHLFKLYPWELLFLDDLENLEDKGVLFFEPLIRENKITFLEPAWKCILSNKAVLSLLWEYAPNHPRLLETWIDDGSPMAEQLKSREHVSKPFFGREGQGVLIFSGETARESGSIDRSTDANMRVVQELAPLSRFGDYHFVLGSWLVEGQFAGVNVRADRNRVTGRNALFVPHFVE